MNLPLLKPFNTLASQNRTATVNSEVPIDVSIKMVRAFYEEAKISNPKIEGGFMPTKSRLMQTAFNRAFGGLSDIVSINSSKAF